MKRTGAKKGAVFGSFLVSHEIVRQPLLTLSVKNGIYPQTFITIRPTKAHRMPAIHLALGFSPKKTAAIAVERIKVAPWFKG